MWGIDIIIFTLTSVIVIDCVLFIQAFVPCDIKHFLGDALREIGVIERFVLIFMSCG